MSEDVVIVDYKIKNSMKTTVDIIVKEFMKFDNSCFENKFILRDEDGVLPEGEQTEFYYGSNPLDGKV